MLFKDIGALLVVLRTLLVDHGLTAYIVPAGDAHNSEYVADCDKRREFITNFTGSAGTAVVTNAPDYALLWTDSRYHIQAERELEGTEWILQKQGEAGVPSINSWLTTNLTKGARVGVDPSLYTKTAFDALFNELRLSDIVLVPIEDNLVDIVWEDNGKPACSDQPVVHHVIEYAGKSTEDKLTDIRRQMTAQRVELLVVSELDEVAWLLNLRGEDIPYNPFLTAYIIILEESFEVFTNTSKVPEDVQEDFKDVNGTFLLYDDVADRLEKLARDATEKIWVSKYCNYLLVNRLVRIPGVSDRLLTRLTPIALMKAIKNEVETKGLIQCHERDGAAVVEYFAWLEEQIVKEGKEDITEISGADKLEEFRRAKELNRGLSFNTISASGLNAALPHYSPTQETNRPITKNEVYLVDSGGQYLDGTTDVTRTIYLGDSPKQEIKDAFTRVLKGVIALRNATFPRWSPGSVLDPYARKALWEAKLDYGHGTGHGIGSYLSVHEGPFSIGGRTGADDPGFTTNMFTSDEPGYYKEGDFGIRIENIIRVVDVKDAEKFVTFEDVTMVPIQTKLINRDLLTPEEVIYLNAYHKTVRETLLKFYGDDQKFTLAKSYLERETEPIALGSAKLAKVSLLLALCAIVAKFL